MVIKICNILQFLSVFNGVLYQEITAFEFRRENQNAIFFQQYYSDSCRNLFASFGFKKSIIKYSTVLYFHTLGFRSTLIFALLGGGGSKSVGGTSKSQLLLLF